VTTLVKRDVSPRLALSSYVVDRDGFIIESSDPKSIPIGTNIIYRPVVQKVITDGRDADGLAADDSYETPSGEQMFVVGLPIPVTGWGAFIEEPTTEALSGSSDVGFLGAMVWLLGLIILYILVRGSYQLKSFNQKLVELDQSKSQFVSIAAHQLRTPVTAFRWTFSSLAKGELGPINSEQEKIIRNGLNASIQMSDLIGDLLNVARIEEGRFGYKMEDTDLARLCALAADNHRQGFATKNVTFNFTLPQTPAQVNVDIEKITIVLDNLLDNALKYTPAGGTVNFDCRVDKKNALISVSDTGIGIPQNEREQLFSKFFRATNAKHNQTYGTGLGLYVTRSIIETHGGTINFTSEENKGTTFECTIPLAKK
jgi:signal transduction histidine kinase